MKVWDKVKLNSKWRSNYSYCNKSPHNLIWTISSFDNDGRVNVDWSSYIFNNYKLDELELVLSYKDLVSSHNPELKEQSSEELNWLPKYYVIKKDTSNPLWIKYIDYVNKTYWFGIGNRFEYYWYDWSSIWKNGFYCYDIIDEFENNPTLITLEQWWTVINKSNEIKDFTLSTPVTATDNLWTITTDYHLNILNTNLWIMQVKKRLNDIISEKFFNNEKNLVAIENLNTTLLDWVKLIEDSIKELMDSKDKLEKLVYTLDYAVNESDIKLLKDLISQTDEVKFFVKQLEETKIEKYKQAAESVFSIKEFLSSKK